MQSYDKPISFCCSTSYRIRPLSYTCTVQAAKLCRLCQRQLLRRSHPLRRHHGRPLLLSPSGHDLRQRMLLWRHAHLRASLRSAIDGVCCALTPFSAARPFAAQLQCPYKAHSRTPAGACPSGVGFRMMKSRFLCHVPGWTMVRFRVRVSTCGEVAGVAYRMNGCAAAL